MPQKAKTLNQVCQEGQKGLGASCVETVARWGVSDLSGAGKNCHKLSLYKMVPRTKRKLTSPADPFAYKIPNRNSFLVHSQRELFPKAFDLAVQT